MPNLLLVRNKPMLLIVAQECAVQAHAKAACAA